MKDLVIEKTGYSPQIEFYANGNLKLKGRSFPEDINNLYNPLINFVCKLCVEKVVFDINLEYFNKPSSKKLLELMRNLEANNNIGSVLINWHYEEGDESSLEIAEVYEELLMRTDFLYHKFVESIVA